MNAAQLKSCRELISPYIHETPVLSSRFLNTLAGCEVFFKCENFQRMGAFKMRGAVYALQQLSKREKEKGVVTHSSGNFAQALSLAAKALEITAYIVMPETAPQVKKDAVRNYGGLITECAATLAERERVTASIVQKTGATFMHPSNDMNVILGNSTACQELLETQPNLHAVWVPVGGGGLLAGTALATSYLAKDCKCYAGEPANMDDAYRSLKSGKIESNTNTHTIADGLKTQLGSVNFPLIQKHVSAIIRVSEEEISKAMRLIWERMKIICEPSSAVAFAALLKEKQHFASQKVGIILSGGNVDLEKLPF